ncbi:MAG: hypothetical protein WBP84_01300, partial [Nitrososphaeraceae archaeon]
LLPVLPPHSLPMISARHDPPGPTSPSLAQPPSPPLPPLPPLAKHLTHLPPNALVAANIITDAIKVAKTIVKVIFIITKKYTGGV